MSTFRDEHASAGEDTTQPEALRERMVGELRELGAIRSDSVAAAVSTVPRHRFAPGEPLDTVYAATRAIVTKRNEHGAALSALSESHIQATMLEQAQIEPGMRVLEIGTGGYNAALIAGLVGEAGQVTSVDIDPDIDPLGDLRTRGRPPGEPGLSALRVRADARRQRPQRAGHRARRGQHHSADRR